MKNTCLFCGKHLKKKRSAEHIFPGWLQRKYNLSNSGLIQTHFSEKGEVISDRLHNLGKHVCGGICSECNNGWMAFLEEKSKNIIIGLAERSLHFDDLNSAQCLVLARWACKTVFCLHAASNYRSIVLDDHFKNLWQNKNCIPEGLWVFGYQHKSTEPFCWWQSPSWFIEGDDDHTSKEFIRLIKNKAYKICFSIKDLILIVVYNPFTDMRLVLLKGIHYPIYPNKGPVFWYKKNNFPKTDTDKVCISFLGSICLKQID